MKKTRKFAKKLLMPLARLLLRMVKGAEKESNLSFVRELGSVGSNCCFGDDMRILGPKYIRVGDNVVIKSHLTMEAIDSYAGYAYSPSIVIGDDVMLHDSCHIGCIESVTIGSGTLIASRVYITDHNHGMIASEDTSEMPKYRPLSHKPVKIGRNVWIGEGVSVLPGVELGDSVIVGANAVVTHSFPTNSVIAGVPAKLIKVL